MKEIFGCIKPYRREVVLAVFCMIVDVICELVSPILMANIIGDAGIKAGNLSYIVGTGALMVVVALIAIAAGFGNARYSARAGVGAAANLRQKLFDQVQTFSFHNIDQFSTASLSVRLTNDVTQMQMLGTMGLRMLVRAPLMLPFALIMALTVSPRLTLILCVVMPVLIAALVFLIRRALPLFVRMQKAVDQLNRVVQEDVTNIRVVKSFVREEHEKEKFAEASRNLMDTALSAMNHIVLAMPLMMLAMNISVLSVVRLGGEQIIGGTFTVAEMTKFISYIFQILMSLLMVAMIFVMISRASASYRRIREVLETKTDLSDADADCETPLCGAVEFRNVAFSYAQGTGEPVLHDLNFRIEPGELVAVIGGTGAGKTTMVQLIPRLYDVTQGEILLDGVDVRRYSFAALHRDIAMVLQKNTLFSGTVAENLRWGDAEATDDEVERAARAAQAHEFIQAMPQGYDTWLEQGGVNVSGGQKQRLCIARAMLRKPRILILDDSTSAVDTATEARIREAFRRELQDTTVILIAQRISSVMEADRILVMDNGSIVGMGTHETLLRDCPAYREICQSQLGEEAVVCPA